MAQSTVSGLLSLPPEIHLLIVEHLSDASDLARLLRVDRTMREVVLANEKPLARRICKQQRLRLIDECEFLRCKGLTIDDALTRYLEEFGPLFDPHSRQYLGVIPAPLFFAEHFYSNGDETPRTHTRSEWITQVADLAGLLWEVHAYWTDPTIHTDMRRLGARFAVRDPAFWFANANHFIYFVRFVPGISFIPPGEIETLFHAARSGGIFGPRPSAQELGRVRYEVRPRTSAAWKGSEHEKLHDVVVGLQGGLTPPLMIDEKMSLRLALVEADGARRQLLIEVKSRAAKGHLRPLHAAALMEVSHVCHAADFSALEM